MAHIGIRNRWLVLLLLIGIPTAAEAGPPLICFPFDPGQAAVLPWGGGPGWNTPDPRYDVGRLTADTLRLLGPEVPVLARMEILRRATIYAARDGRVADALLAAMTARAAQHAHALFDAGYLIESYKQAAHLHGRAAPSADGYAMVTRAIALTGAPGDMEFAASLMRSGAAAEAHRRRALASAAPGSALARHLAEHR